MAAKITLNDLLHMENLSNVKIRMNVPNSGDWKPLELVRSDSKQELLNGNYWNYSEGNGNFYKEGDISICLVRLSKESCTWLLYHIGCVTKVLNKFDSVGYKWEELIEYEKYFKRVVIKYKNTSQNLVRKAESIINDCEVYQILPDTFDDDIFPGYENVNVSWEELSRVIHKDSWQTALRNQKGVYLITDIKTGKRYIGSAYGENMILGRWLDYIKSGHGGNKELKKLTFDYIKTNFRYSILDIFKNTTDDETIIGRESWWKENLLTRDSRYGYNDN